MLAAAGICLAASGQMKHHGVFQATMLDVGQGDGIFLRTPNGRTCFVDGGSSDISKVGEYRIVPFLESQGVKELDYVFVSHGDADHMMESRKSFRIRPLEYESKIWCCRR